MIRRNVPILLTLLATVLVVSGFLLAGGRASQAAPAPLSPPGASDVKLPPMQPTVSTAVKFDISPPLRSIPPITSQPSSPPTIHDPGAIPAGPVGPRVLDPVVQKLLAPPAIPTPIISFNGPSNLCGGCAPPDPNGEVGPNDVVVMSNLDFQIFDKTGTSLFGPAANNTLWSGFGGGCQTQNAGDPVVLYDQLADRWLLTQFTASAPYYNCVALSQTSDPTGAYYRWAFPVGNGNNFGDYPKYGMMPDAYFISTREFAGGNTFVGVGAYALDRAQMLTGNPNPTVISFLAPPNPAYVVGDGLLPADLDGTTLPPGGSDEYYMGSEDDNGSYGAPSDALTLWKFHVDFPTPANSSFTLANTIASAPFNSILGLCGGTRACIPQPGTTNKIDHLGYRQRPLFRLAYRNMGTYETLLTNQSVSAGTGPSGEVSGIRWWEVRSPASSPAIYQQGTYAPGLTDGIHRWMGSIAMDHDGNIAMGYSAGNSTTFPSVYYTGRMAGDPLGQMTLGEAAIINGTGSQTGGGNRWGDYTDTTVDPVDDCTFWHVNEYVPTTSGAGWRLRIGAFQLPGCAAQATPTPTATGTPPTNTPTSTPTNTPTNAPTNTPTATPPSCGENSNYSIATATGTIVAGSTDTGSHCDDCDTAVTLPFSFRLYDQTFSSVNVSSNGRVDFVTVNEPGGFTTSCLPAPPNIGPFDYTIFPYWADQRTDIVGEGCSAFPSGCGIFTSVSGTAPDRIFNIEWRTVYFNDHTQTANYEVRLYENSPTGQFDTVYGAVAIPSGEPNTLGVQGPNGLFTEFECNTGGLTAGLLLTFTQPPCITPTVAASNTATPTHAAPSATSTTVVEPTHTSTPVGPTPTACAIQFTDVRPGSTFYQFIHCLVCLGIVNGYPNGTFRPGADVTRGQLSKIVANSAGFNDTPSGQQFQDVPVGSTFYDYIYRLVHRGFISGYPCGGSPAEPCVPPDNLPYFRPNAPASRGQISKIVSNAAGYNETPTGQQFQDVPATGPGSTFYVYIYRLVTHNIINGYLCGSVPQEPCVPPDNLPYFRPNNNATRGQMAKIDGGGFFPDCNISDGSTR